MTNLVLLAITTLTNYTAVAYMAPRDYTKPREGHAKFVESNVVCCVSQQFHVGTSDGKELFMIRARDGRCSYGGTHINEPMVPKRKEEEKKDGDIK